MGDLHAKLDQVLAALVDLKPRITAIEERLHGMDERLEAIEKKLRRVVNAQP